MDAARNVEPEELNHEDHPAELLELKRRAAENGLVVHLPGPGSKWIEREPIDFGASASDAVIRNRGRKPDAPLPPPVIDDGTAPVSGHQRTDDEAPEAAYPPELLELKRNAARNGLTLHLPRPGAKWIEPEPIDFGVSASDVVVRNRGKVP